MTYLGDEAGTATAVAAGTSRVGDWINFFLDTEAQKRAERTAEQLRSLSEQGRDEAKFDYMVYLPYAAGAVALLLVGVFLLRR